MSALASPDAHAVSPRTLKQVVRQLARDPDLVPIAGGTDLMVTGIDESRRGRRILDLGRVRDLHGIRREEDVWRIGATTTFAALRRSRLLRASVPILTEAAGMIGGRQIQNRATLGGNMANASPAGDSLPVLLALDARVVAAGPEGGREIPYSGFHTGYRTVDLRRGEIIAYVLVPDPGGDSIQRFRKVGTREAQAISKVVVAMAATRREGELVDVRFGAGSVAATPIRLSAVEQVCTGRAPTPDLAARAAEAAMDSVTPIDDVRSTAEYRRLVLGRVVRRMILDCLGKEPS